MKALAILRTNPDGSPDTPVPLTGFVHIGSATLVPGYKAMTVTFAESDLTVLAADPDTVVMLLLTEDQENGVMWPEIRLSWPDELAKLNNLLATVGVQLPPGTTLLQAARLTAPNFDVGTHDVADSADA